MALSTGFKKIKTAVFISGAGSNLKSLIKFSRLKKSPISINLIISNNPKSKGLSFAQIFKIKKKTYNFKRKIYTEKKINIKKSKFLKKELLRPTKIYVKEVLKLIEKNLINGCANITGGGLADNIKRVIPDNLVAEINLDKVKTSKIFKWLKKNNISDKEMLRTFNCGVGFCLIINPNKYEKIKKYFTKKFMPYVIGKISKGKNKVKLNGSINWI